MNYKTFLKKVLTIEIEIVHRRQLCEEKRAIYNFANDNFFQSLIIKTIFYHILDLQNYLKKIDYFLSGKIIIFWYRKWSRQAFKDANLRLFNGHIV